MNENMAVRPDDEAKLSDVITHTAEILDGVEGLVEGDAEIERIVKVGGVDG